MTLFLAHHLEQDMVKLLQEQQFAAATDIANSIDEELKFRIGMLEATASLITPEMLERPEQIRTYLKQNPDLFIPFSLGAIVISNEGTGIADYPIQPGHANAKFNEREYFNYVINTNEPYIGTPRIGRFSKVPEVGFAVPIFDKSRKRIAVLAGYSPLTDSDLLGSLDKTLQSDFIDRVLIASYRDKLFVTGSDPSRTLTQPPKPGVNPLLDKFMAGYEGSGVMVNSRGIKLLASAKKIPSAGWFARVGVPTDIAFEPIHHMERMAYSIATGMTVMVGLLIWFVIRQSLQPLYAASSRISSMAKHKGHMELLQAKGTDEIGQLITSFNSLVTERNELEKKLEEKANIDYLTGINNRGSFMQLAETELARAVRYDNDLAVLMMDIDHFKEINDQHGHKAGDAVLKKLAKVCLNTLREVDIIGRVGGEEFAILLPETNKAEAAEVAERLRTALESTRVPIENGLPLIFTASIGVASLASKEDNLDVLLNLADKALYSAKSSGRNRVSVAQQ